MTLYQRLSAWLTKRHRLALAMEYHPRLEALRRLEGRSDRRKGELVQLRVVREQRRLVA